MKTIVLFLLFSIHCLNAQQSVNASGGKGTGTGGSFSFSIGQIDYVAAVGTNGSVSEGVQQPFEIFVLGTDEIPDIKLALSVYPNPTTDLLFIKNEDSNLEFNYQLFDVTGKLLSSSAKMEQVNQIDMALFKTGTYILLIQTESNVTKSFKIIKK